MAYDLSELLYLLSPEGRTAMIAAVREARAQTGKDLTGYVKAQFPALHDAIYLAANGTAEEAFDWIKNEAEATAGPFGAMGIAIYRPQILALHATLRAEIDKPRAALPANQRRER